MENAQAQSHKEFLVKLLTRNRNGESAGIAIECINEAKPEHIERAYEAVVYGNASDKKAIYLLGGNEPSKCPFV